MWLLFGTLTPMYPHAQSNPSQPNKKGSNCSQRLGFNSVYVCVCVLFLLKIRKDSFYNVEMSLQSYYILLSISITMHEILEFHLGMLLLTFIVFNLNTVSSL